MLVSLLLVFINTMILFDVRASEGTPSRAIEEFAEMVNAPIESKSNQRRELIPLNTSKPRNASRTISIIELNGRLQAWKDAIEGADLDLYLSIYSEEFRPTMSEDIDAWVFIRNQRKSSESPVRIKLYNHNYSCSDNFNRCTVGFLEVVEIDRHEIRSLSKTLVFRKISGNWLILDECVICG